MSSVTAARNELRVAKATLTKLFNKVFEKAESELNEHYLMEVKSQAKTKFEEVLKSEKTVALCICNMESVSEDAIDVELQTQIDKDTLYNDKTNESMAKLVSLTNKIASAPVDGGEVNNVLGNSVNLKLPELKIANFADNSKDPFEFFRFYSSFNNALNSIQGVSKAVKLVYLKAYLYGRALQLVENLPIEEDSYDIAWNLLKSEFFDKDLLVNDTLSSIINWPCNESLEQTMKFITYLKSKLFD